MRTADAVTGAIRYYDGQFYDARHTINISRTAAHFGALVATRTRVVGFLRAGERVTGARIVDLETGVGSVADPLGGSAYVEWMTDELERRAEAVFARLRDAGGGSMLEGVRWKT